MLNVPSWLRLLRCVRIILVNVCMHQVIGLGVSAAERLCVCVKREFPSVWCKCEISSLDGNNFTILFLRIERNSFEAEIGENALNGCS